MSPSEQLRADNAELWEQMVGHPFVAAAADGSLSQEAFDRWIVEDHHFVVGFQRYLGRMLDLAPDDESRSVIAGGLAAITPELGIFREAAARRGLDLDAEPSPTTLGYTAFIQASPSDGFLVGLTVLLGAEQAYHDAWAAVRAQAERTSPYWDFIDNWSSQAFADYVTAIAATLDRLLGDVVPPACATAFSRVVRFELRFWDAVHAGEDWTR